MKIAIARSSLPGFGGGERFVLEEARFLERKGHDVKIVTWKYSPEQTFPEFKKFDVVQAQSHSPFFKLVYWATGKVQADVVSANGFPSNFMSFNNPTYAYFHIIPAYHDWQGANALPKHALRSVDVESVKRAKGVGTNSTGMAALVRKHYGVKADVIHPGVNIADFKPGKFKDYALCASRISPEKNMVDLVHNWNSDVELVVAGTGDPVYVAEVHAAAKGKNVRFVGRVDDKQLKKLYADCLCFVQLAKAEPFGMVFLEAMAAGKPVIAWDSMGPKDIVTKETGFLVDSSKKVKGKIDFLIEDSARLKRMSIAARKRASEFPWTKTFSAIEKRLLHAGKRHHSRA